jgi:hypothetical protein
LDFAAGAAFISFQKLNRFFVLTGLPLAIPHYFLLDDELGFQLSNFFLNYDKLWLIDLLIALGLNYGSDDLGRVIWSIPAVSDQES